METLPLDAIRTYLSSAPIEKAWLFGSFARGEENDKSDVDLLVSFDKEAKVSLLKRAAITCDLEDILCRPVDLVNELSLFPEVRKEIDNDKILIYERSA